MPVSDSRGKAFVWVGVNAAFNTTQPILTAHNGLANNSIAVEGDVQNDSNATADFRIRLSCITTLSAAEFML